MSHPHPVNPPDAEPWNQPSTGTQRWLDKLLEISGTFRLRLAMRRSIVSLRATVKSPSRLFVGSDVTVQQGAIIHCGGKRWCGYRGHVRLADGVKVGPYAILYGAGGITLESHVHLGPGAKIMSQAGKHDTNRITATPTYQNEPVHVGTGTWIGAGAVILGGSRIGRCVSVAPNAVVSGSVPDGAVVAGNPGRIVFRNEVEQQ